MSVKNIEEIKNKLASISKITEGNTISGSSKRGTKYSYNQSQFRLYAGMNHSQVSRHKKYNFFRGSRLFCLLPI